MKRILTVTIIGLLCFSMFGVLAPKASADSDLLSLPAGPYGWQYSDSSNNALMTNPLAGPLISVSEQSITVSPGQTVSVSVTYQVFVQSPPNNPSEIDQLFFVESWTTGWPPQGYTIPLYNGMPGLSPGVTQTNTISFTVPSVGGTCYLWLCFEAQYSMQDAVNQRTQSMAGLPGHIRIIVSPQAGPVGYWKFDEGAGNTASDSSGNGNDGTIYGASWTSGISSGALRFDGADDHVNVPNSASLAVSGNQISVGLWMKPAVTLDATTPLTLLLDKGDEYGFQMDPASSGGRIWFFVWLASAPWQGITTTTDRWEANTWYYLIGTYDGSYLRVYVNGVLENSRPLSGDLYRSGFPLSIGSYCLGTMCFFNGAIDEVKIHNYARTSEEIWNDYQSVAAPTPPLNLKASSLDSAVVLTWDKPTYSGSSAIARYRIYRGTSPGTEAFLNFVDGNTLSYEDLPGDSLYYYYVTAENLDGKEGPHSNEVRCSSVEGFKGIEAQVAVDHYKTRDRERFTIQENFIVPIDFETDQNTGLQVLSKYYAFQNVIDVSTKANVMKATVEVWMNVKEGGEWATPVEIDRKDSLLVKADLSNIVLRAIIIGDTVEIINNVFSQPYVCWLAPFDSYPYVYVNPFDDWGQQYPELVLVASSDSVDFVNPTSGHVNLYAKAGSETWMQASTTGIAMYPLTMTAETSTGLTWDKETGQFFDEAGSVQEGFFFTLDSANGQIVTPPEVPHSTNKATALIVNGQCPIQLNIHDSQGRHTGYNISTSGIDTNIPFSEYVYNSEVNLIVVDPSGLYNLEVIGTGNGNYSLEILWQSAVDSEDSPSVVWKYRGVISDHEIQNFLVSISGTRVTFSMNADIDINPKSLNLISKGKWVTAYVELGKSFNMQNINISSIMLNGTIPVAPSAPVTIGDYDDDGIPDLMVKFDRATVESWIYNTQGIRYGNVALTITGELLDGTPFRGTDVISVNYAGDANNDRAINIFDILAVKSRWETTPDSSSWVPDYDVNGDEAINIFDVLIIKSNWEQTTP